MTATQAFWERFEQKTLLVRFRADAPYGCVVLSTLGPNGRRRRPSPLTTRLNPGGYLTISIKRGGRSFTCLLHRCAWMAWNRERLNVGEEIDHRDQQKTNCHWRNLLRTSRTGNLFRRDARNGWNGSTTAHLSEEEREAYYVSIYGEF